MVKDFHRLETWSQAKAIHDPTRMALSREGLKMSNLKPFTIQRYSTGSTGRVALNFQDFTSKL